MAGRSHLGSPGLCQQGLVVGLLGLQLGPVRQPGSRQVALGLLPGGRDAPQLLALHGHLRCKFLAGQLGSLQLLAQLLDGAFLRELLLAELLPLRHDLHAQPKISHPDQGLDASCRCVDHWQS